MADEPTNNGLDNGPVNDSGDEQHLPDGSLEPLSPQEADNTDYGLMVGQRVQPIDLQDEMRQSYLSYALSVIVERALPDVRDGMKPVHRRVVYAMYDGGYRPDRGYNKCSRVVGDVMGKYHPHGDSAIYDTLVRMAQSWSMRYLLVDGQGNFGSPGDDPAAAMRYTECRMAPLAMEMVRDIDKDTVDFVPNYDGKTQEPTVLPARFPNLLVNGSSGIAVGMATNIPPHNMREVADGVHWALDHPEASREELLDALIERIKGPDFPTGATILGHKGIEQAYRTGRGLITMRAVVNTEEIKGRMCLVVTELPYQVNPDRLVASIREAVRDGKITGIADMRDETSGRTGQRLVLVLKRDAVPKVVLNNLYKHSQLQQTFGANMLALVDGVPRTLSLDAFIRHWVSHQLDVIARRTAYLKREAEERDHILQGYLKALDMIDEVIHLIRSSQTVEIARTGLMDLLDVDDVQADAILAMQLRRLAALERQKILDEHDELMRRIADYADILAKPERQRKIVGDELDEIVARYGDDRRTKILPFSGEMNVEDLIAEENVVVTVTHAGFIKRTKADEYRAQHRGGKGIKGAKLRDDDVVDHFFLTSTHNWLLFFTNKGRVYRCKAYELPEGSRDSKGQHVANLLQFTPDESIQTVLSIPDYEVADYLVLATRSGKVKKTRLSEYDSPRQGGLIAVRLMQDESGETADELIGAALCNATDDIILVSKLGMSLKFRADDEQLRPMGRQTAGVQGMKFRAGDELLAMDVIWGETDKDLLVVTNQGFAKRTAISEYRLQGRNGFGVKAVQLTDERGTLVGAVVVSEEDQIMAIMKSGKVIRSNVSEVKLTGRTTQGVTLAKPDAGDEIISIARNAETEDEADGDTVVTESSAGSTETQLAQGEPVFEVKSEDGMPVIEEESAAIDKTQEATQEE
ncbi:DNA gyrase subunit A [Bifidobacterium animalis subsp. animalis MCC 0483]|uniref:DNA gyrase subunit A n=1 Tax=Bifidobacterium animalis subsp. animalis MCC 0483 TaxID=1365955 RepID=A0AB34T9P3_9BIFI|nr:DNA gyrase subunit A [Bifidobacterium animalis]ANU43338.1 DNA gyrase subunit A [Bifidobacterium animalis subsp. animalis]KOA50874.1 DNA gyrase subunit A [Bifidobacterium animalis subsp. animalis MCC 0483]PHQ53943.1 DNA gyrase subunit A [Bifidobacterium animalis subsp. animalis]QQQ89569.1 DNA gyrase subunit A [Bifidobacterium animalis]UQE64005.1 DNA gyrase subunit A [Bifidobacterium animalis]